MEKSSANQLHQIRSALFGLAVGDALGFPVEFTSRSSLKRNPLLGMREFGTHGQPAGIWSDGNSRFLPYGSLV